MNFWRARPDINPNTTARESPNGMTVRELKDAVANWPETNEHTGEPNEVWLRVGEGLTSIATGVSPLNKRVIDGKESADFLLEMDEQGVTDTLIYSKYGGYRQKRVDEL